VRRSPLVASAVLIAASLVAATLALCTRIGDGGPEPGVLRLGLVRTASLDPARAATLDEQLVADQLFDSLTAWDPDTGDVVPALASSWTVSDDGLQWAFTLRGGARFSDGSSVRGADVKATFDRIGAAATSSSVRDLLAGVTVGVDAPTGKVVFDLAAPWADLASALANPAFGVMPARVAARGARLPDRLVGSGPFRVASSSSSSSSASAKDHLVLEPVPGRGVKLRGVDVRFFADRTAAYHAFVGGKVDWSEVPTGKVEEAAARFGRRYFRPYAAEVFYAFNLRSPKWADKRLREAVVRAVDRDAIAEGVYHGAVRPLAGVLPAGVGGHVPDACGATCAVDVERAKALVAEVAADAGGAAPEVTVDFESDTVQRSVAQTMQRSLEAVGIKVTLRPKALADYQRFAVSGQADLFRLGWVPAYPAADAYLHPLFASASADNVPGFALSTVDDLLRSARATMDGAARAALYQQAEQAVLAEVPLVPLAQFELHGVASKRVRGLELGVMGTFDASAVSIASS
jgi:ABC-type transport system substrate-binding protein